jgi:hypothetical protein
MKDSISLLSLLQMYEVHIFCVLSVMDRLLNAAGHVSFVFLPQVVNIVLIYIAP